MVTRMAQPFIKEFMEFHRTGPHQNFWRLKSTLKHPTRAEMLRIVEPEQVVLHEAMIVGTQHLQDSGYDKSTFGDGEVNDEDANKLPLEQQLSPWLTTKSFVSAATKGTLMKLHGDGDPTGRGEAFSFIRASAKTPFVKAGEDPEVKEGITKLCVIVHMLNHPQPSRSCPENKITTSVHSR